VSEDVIDIIYITLEQYKIVNLNSNSTAVFGGLPVVIVLGDFHLFPPVKAKALWQQPRNRDEERGQELWHDVDEQMRQRQDPIEVSSVVEMDQRRHRHAGRCRPFKHQGRDITGIRICLA
jgi:hypothetical protein